MRNTEPVYNRQNTLTPPFDIEKVARLVADQISDSHTKSSSLQDLRLAGFQHHLVFFSGERARDLVHLDDLVSRLKKITGEAVWDNQVRDTIVNEYQEFWRTDLRNRRIQESAPECKRALYSVLPVGIVTDIVWEIEKNMRNEMNAEDFVLDVAHPMLKSAGIAPEQRNQACQILLTYYQKLVPYFIE